MTQVEEYEENMEEAGAGANVGAPLSVSELEVGPLPFSSSIFPCFTPY